MRQVTFVLILLLALILSSFTTGLLAFSSSTNSNDYVPYELLVKFKPSTPASVIAAVHRQNQAAVKDEIHQIGIQVVRFSKGDVMGKVKAYSSNPNVLYAEPNYIAYALTSPNDTHFGKEWGIDNTGQEYKPGVNGTFDADIDAKEAWDITTGSSGVRIAILDTGIDQDHPDLASKIVANFNFTDSPDEDDHYGHGTHVAGTAAAITGNNQGVAGVGYNSSLMNIKVLNDSGSGAYSWVAQGIVWAADNGARVINMSLGGNGKSKTLEQAVNYAWGNGVVLVAAAGNSNNPSPTYPARYDNVIAVAATDSNDQKASFSSYGDWVDVAAPGVDIFSTFPNHTFYLQEKYGRENNYDFANGTSMSTPHVAGLTALIWATGFGTNQQEAVRYRIETTADPIPGTGTYWTWGRVNACNAVGGNCTYYGAAPTSTPTPTPTTTQPTATPTPTPTIQPSGTMHVSDILMWYGKKSPSYFVYTKVTVVSETGSPVFEALVDLVTTLPDGSTVSNSGLTDGNGEVVFKVKSRDTGIYTSQITSVNKDGWIYDPTISQTSATISAP